MLCAPSVYFSSTEVEITQEIVDGTTHYTISDRSIFSKPSDPKTISHYYADGVPRSHTVYDPMDGSPSIETHTATCNRNALIIKEKSNIANLQYKYYKSGGTLIEKITGDFLWEPINDRLICQ